LTESTELRGPGLLVQVVKPGSTAGRAGRAPLLPSLLVGAVVEADQLLRPQCGYGVGPSSIVTELDLGHGGGEQFNDRSNLIANQSYLGHVAQHSDFVTHTSLIPKNIKRNKPRSSFASQGNPATPNAGSAFAAAQLKVCYVPSSIPIGSAECGFFFHCRTEQHCAKFFGMSGSHPQMGLKNSRLMPFSWVAGIQAIVSKFLYLDNRSLAVR